MTITEGDTVTIEYTGRRADGSVFSTSRESVAIDSGLADEQPGGEYSPLTVEIGSGELIEGLEEALVGTEEGDSLSVELPPEKAYEWSEENVREFGAGQLAQVVGEMPEEGEYVRTQDGSVAEVLHQDSDVVRLDFNHQLAGETLAFDVEVVDVR